MGQVTIRGVDTAMGRALKGEAKRRRLSINRTVLELIREAVGQSEREPCGARTFDDLDHLAGTWKEKDARELLDAIEASREIDGALWR